MNHWIMDYETLANCFVGVFEHYKTSERKVFIVHDLKNDFHKFIDFLKENQENREWHISYNGLAFDSQITHYILDNYLMWEALSGCQISEIIYQYAAKCIQQSDKKAFQDYPQWKMSIGQIDIFKMHHWDNPAKRSSLKWIQYSMDWDNILEMPIHHGTKIETMEQINTIVEYCINDISSTKEIFKKSESQIRLRKALSETYNINLFSASEPRISKELFAYYMSEKLNIPKKDIKNMRTYRTSIKLADVILPFVEFKSPEFKDLLEKFKKVELDPTNLKGSFSYSVMYKNVKTDFGLGGVHGANKAGVYTSNDDYVIMSSDVTSFYPNLVIRNKWSPGHFPKQEFCDQYEWFFEERKKIPKKDPMNYVYKIILNSTFGLSNDENSFFYDPELTMRITVNGQLTLMMLYEMIMESIPDATPLMQNTDGIEIRIPRAYKDQYLEICAQWEKLTNLQLEHDEYQKLVLADVNNYIGLNNFKQVDITTWRNIKKEFPHYVYKVDGDKFLYAPTKLKGRFDFHDLALHKNKSKLIIPKAIYHYFIHGVEPAQYLSQNRNILDYCIGSKSKGDWKQVSRNVAINNLKEEELQKINRYFISKGGVKIIKVNKTDGREIQLEAGRWLQTLFNKMQLSPKWDAYRVDESYYLDAIKREIEKIDEPKTRQLSLF
ncbi:MAG: hypothetical protein E6R13_00100 [Spirochaetes bacterium]|nr:MAG: hypothetical protein E6R13_00100 [Spirochaetota bacterium]